MGDTHITGRHIGGGTHITGIHISLRHLHLYQRVEKQEGSSSIGIHINRINEQHGAVP